MGKGSISFQSSSVLAHACANIKGGGNDVNGYGILSVSGGTSSVSGADGTSLTMIRNRGEAEDGGQIYWAEGAVKTVSVELLESSDAAIEYVGHRDVRVCAGGGSTVTLSEYGESEPDVTIEQEAGQTFEASFDNYAVEGLEGFSIEGAGSGRVHASMCPDGLVVTGCTELTVTNADGRSDSASNLDGGSSYTIRLGDAQTDPEIEMPKAHRYTVTKKVSGKGKIELQSATLHPRGGSTVVLRTLPDAGQTLAAFNVTYTDPDTGERVKLVTGKGITRAAGTGAAGTKSEYSFTMPGCDVTISATFKANGNTYAIAKNITGRKARGSNLQLVGSDGRPPETTRDKVKPTMHPKAGQTVYFKSVPASGSKLTKFNVTYTYTGLDGASHSAKLVTGSGITSHGGGLYSFQMPCRPVKLTGEFTSTMPSQYNAVISAYRSAMNSSSTPTSSYVNTDAWIEHRYDNATIRYALYDINGNGSPELLIETTSQSSGHTGITAGYKIYDLYTVDTGECHRSLGQTDIGALGQRGYCIPCKNKVLLLGGSGGMSHHEMTFNRMNSIANSMNFSMSNKIVIEGNEYTFYSAGSSPVTASGSYAQSRYNSVISKYTPIASFTWKTL